MLKVIEKNGKDGDPSMGGSESDKAMPSFTWAELEEALTSIAASERQREMTPALVSATRKQAPFLPRSQVLREILSLAWVIADESFGETPGHR